jgi:predicted O-methyltransferase YrrM
VSSTDPTTQELKQEIQMPEGFTGVLIATPAYGATVTAGYARALAGTIYFLEQIGIPAFLFMVTNNSLISSARDTIAAAFGSMQFSHLLMADADIEWQPAAVLQLLADARKHEVVLGTYRKKKDEVQWTVRFPEDKPLNQDPETGCVEIEYGGAGFCLMAKSVLDKMAKAFPDLKYESLDTYDAHRFAFYTPFQAAPGRPPWGEDAAFFARWRQIGGQVWLDPRINLKHWDGAKCYTGRTRDIFQLPGGMKRIADLEKLIRPALDVEGWLSEPQALLLATAASRVKEGCVVELGSWKGRSTSVLGLVCKGIRPVIAVDSWTGAPGSGADGHAEALLHPEGVFAQWQANMERLDLLDTVQARHGDTAEVAKNPNLPDKIGMLFIDAEHSTQKVLDDFRAWEPYLLEGATVIFHDFDWTSVQAAIAELGIVVEIVHDMALWTKLPAQKEAIA